MNEFIPLFGKFGQVISPLTQVSEPVLKYFMCQIIFVVRSFKSMRVKFTELSLIDIYIKVDQFWRFDHNIFQYLPS